MITPQDILTLAEKLDILYGGMASVNILYHPYEGEWIVKVSWSSGFTLVENHYNLDFTMESMQKELLWCINNLT